MSGGIDFDRFMEATQTVITLKPGITLTPEQVTEIQYAFECERQHEDDAVDAFHKGYLHGLRTAAGAEMAALIEKIDGLRMALATEKALSKFYAAEVQAARQSTPAPDCDGDPS